jgi:hypothetical protein
MNAKREKHQIPNLKQTSNPNDQTLTPCESRFDHWGLRFVWDLVLGICNFRSFGGFQLSFTSFFSLAER